MSMDGNPTLLAVLLEDRGLHRYASFCAAYQKAARALDLGLGVSAPSRAQFHRWVSGELRSIPYTEHCRVLEHLLAGYSARQLLQPCPDGRIPAPARGDGKKADDMTLHVAPATAALVMADVCAVFASRSEFAARVEPQALLSGADRIRAVGLSLNLICQQLPDQYLGRLLADGAELTCLFLDPEGEAIRAREREEEHAAGFLPTLTRLNIDLMARLRDRLAAPARDRLRIAVYDETIRFNIVLAGEHLRCAALPPPGPRDRLPDPAHSQYRRFRWSLSGVRAHL
jgi:hypothetical protein